MCCQSLLLYQHQHHLTLPARPHNWPCSPPPPSTKPTLPQRHPPSPRMRAREGRPPGESWGGGRGLPWDTADGAHLAHHTPHSPHTATSHTIPLTHHTPYHSHTTHCHITHHTTHTPYSATSHHHTPHSVTSHTNNSHKYTQI
ncbi:hypothetical protein Pcinc_024637 [Petrolisthes cinctipes]|uniref:Uncharacterized protein n=1 Tax=Petrolisthes cinctipes TaxID=88211 RepID=A0AAE1FAJ7_PETCI|nr:hypothetical protein Pcinc_024637 [Petrolisthes cinctipes]